jgi:Zn-finger nucleic acid-binding protein
MKKCPVCQKNQLGQVLLENELPAYECSECGGLWISSQEYLAWNGSQPNSLSQEVKLEGDLPFPVMDNRKATLCPDCGRILRRFKLWPDIEFHLDRCGGCNGVWFDKNEWQALSYHNLNHQVNLFFTDVWQQRLKNEEMRRRFEKMYLEKFGAEDYQKIKEIRHWLEKHPHGGGLMAYLTDRDPYKG